MSKKNSQVNNPYDHSDLPKAKNIFVKIGGTWKKTARMGNTVN